MAMDMNILERIEELMDLGMSEEDASVIADNEFGTDDDEPDSGWNGDWLSYDWERDPLGIL